MLAKKTYEVDCWNYQVGPAWLQVLLFPTSSTRHKKIVKQMIVASAQFIPNMITYTFYFHAIVYSFPPFVKDIEKEKKEDEEENFSLSKVRTLETQKNWYPKSRLVSTTPHKTTFEMINPVLFFLSLTLRSYNAKI